jgi:hypothetical protein
MNTMRYSRTAKSMLISKEEQKKLKLADIQHTKKVLTAKD